MFSFNCSNEVAPTILLVTNGLLLTKQLARVLGEILCFFDKATYFLIAFSPRRVSCLENLLGHKVYLQFFGFFSFIYLPLNLPPAIGE